MTTEISQPTSDDAALRAGDDDRAFAQQIAAQLRATADSKTLRRAMAISSVALGALLTGMVVWILVSGREYVRDLRQIKADAAESKERFINELAALHGDNTKLTQELNEAMREVTNAKQTLADTQEQLRGAKLQFERQINENWHHIQQMESGLDQRIQKKVDAAVATYRDQLTQSTEQARKAVRDEGATVGGKFADAKQAADRAKNAADQAATSIASTATAAAEPARKAAIEAKAAAEKAKSAIEDLTKRVDSLENAGKPASQSGGDLHKKEDDKESGEHSKSETPSNLPQRNDAKDASAPKTESAKRNDK